LIAQRTHKTSLNRYTSIYIKYLQGRTNRGFCSPYLGSFLYNKEKRKMKDWRNTSSGDVSSTSRTSQSLTDSSQALRMTSSSNSILCRSSYRKISQNSLDSDPSLSRISHMQKLFEKMAKIPETWTFLSLEISKHAKASRIAQTLLQNLISGLNRWLCLC